MKKMILVPILLAALCLANFGQEGKKRGGQFGLYFESSELYWLALSGISLNLGMNAGDKVRFELAGMYFPLFSSDGGGTTVVAFSLAALTRVVDSGRLSILVGPGYKLTGYLYDGEGEWRSCVQLKGIAEYRIGERWGMRAGFTENLVFGAGDHDDYTRLSSGVEWGFFQRF